MNDSHPSNPLDTMPEITVVYDSLNSRGSEAPNKASLSDQELSRTSTYDDMTNVKIYKHRVCASCFLEEISANRTNYFNVKCPCCKKLPSYHAMVQYIATVIPNLPSNPPAGHVPHRLVNALIEMLLDQLNPLTFVYSFNIRDRETLKTLSLYLMKLNLTMNQKNLSECLVIAEKALADGARIESLTAPKTTTSVKIIQKYSSTLYKKSLLLHRLDDFDYFFELTQNSHYSSQVSLYYAKILHLLNCPNIAVGKVTEYLIPMIIPCQFSTKISKSAPAYNKTMQRYIEDYQSKFDIEEVGHELTLEIILRLNMKFEKPEELDNLVIKYAAIGKLKLGRLVNFLHRAMGMCNWENSDGNRRETMLQIIRALVNHYKPHSASFDEILRFGRLISQYPIVRGNMLQSLFDNIMGSDNRIYPALMDELLTKIAEGRKRGVFASLETELKCFSGGLTINKNFLFFKQFATLLNDHDTKTVYLPELMKYGVVGLEDGISQKMKEKALYHPACVSYANAMLIFLARYLMKARESNLQANAFHPHIKLLMKRLKNVMDYLSTIVNRSFISTFDDAKIMIGYTIFYNSVVRQFLLEDVQDIVLALPTGLTPNGCNNVFICLVNHYFAAQSAEYRNDLRCIFPAVLSYYYHADGTTFADKYPKEDFMKVGIKTALRINTDLVNIFTVHLHENEAYLQILMDAFIDYNLNLLSDQKLEFTDLKKKYKDYKSRANRTVHPKPNFTTVEDAEYELMNCVGAFLTHRHNNKVALALAKTAIQRYIKTNIVNRASEAIRNRYSQETAQFKSDSLLQLFTLQKLFRK